jgi:hypothetical protein
MATILPFEEPLRPATAPDGPQPVAPAEASRLLSRLDTWPFVRIERRGLCAVVYGGDCDQVVATLDLRSCVLTADVAGELRRRLLDHHPRLQPTGHGVRLHVTDAEDRLAAEALLRWQIDLERFAPQWREASP